MTLLLRLAIYSDRTNTFVEEWVLATMRGCELT